MSSTEIAEIEKQIGQLTEKLRALQKNHKGVKVKNYSFNTLEGRRSLLDLFAGKNQLLLIHNMGQACRYCTLWGDGINPFIEHLEPLMSVAMASKDAPETQRKFANSRGWRFRTVSHNGGEYMQEQIAGQGMTNAPGVTCYELRGNDIYRTNTSYFGPGDLYCSIWHFLALAGIDLYEWTPQYNYWQRPQKMEDGGENLLE